MTDEQDWLDAFFEGTIKLKDIAYCSITQEMCRASVSYDPKTLADVPSHLLDESMIMEAIRLDPAAIEFVPYEPFRHVYRDWAVVAIRENAEAVSLLHPPFVQKHGTILVCEEPVCLKFMTPAQRTYDVIVSAIELDEIQLLYCPPEEIETLHLIPIILQLQNWFYMTPHVKTLGQLLLTRPDLAPFPKPSLNEVLEGIQSVDKDVSLDAQKEALFHLAYLGHFDLHEVAAHTSNGQVFQLAMKVFPPDDFKQACLKHERTRDYVLEADLGL
jgi:hypothetical protein